MKSIKLSLLTVFMALLAMAFSSTFEYKYVDPSNSSDNESATATYTIDGSTVKYVASDATKGGGVLNISSDYSTLTDAEDSSMVFTRQ